MAKGEDQVEPRRAEHVCPVCKQPVETVVKRRKVLGAYVPSWGPGPCHHEGCPARVDEGEAEKPAWKPSRGERLDRLNNP
ncbi:hypothetical protein [Streptomyces cavernicola]|uniref:Uncharacterized protein n=1 Tax=Streptomyces cavernicola TaxID=3043613 RepID=A0ABT6SKE4_9ACTN|nr:hypothetical protein [Streptomyces sp. B-S-A6]MDI3408661.1 hypothetical protein [Streptomyces sp. B-S-A6]